MVERYPLRALVQVLELDGAGDPVRWSVLNPCNSIVTAYGSPQHEDPHHDDPQHEDRVDPPFWEAYNRRHAADGCVPDLVYGDLNAGGGVRPL